MNHMLWPSQSPDFNTVDKLFFLHSHYQGISLGRKAFHPSIKGLRDLNAVCQESIKLQHFSLICHSSTRHANCIQIQTIIKLTF